MSNIILQEKSNSALSINLAVTNQSVTITTSTPAGEGETPVTKSASFTVSDFPNSDKDWQAYLVKSGETISKPLSFNALTLGDRETRQSYTEKNEIHPLLVILAPYAISKVGLDSLTYLVCESIEELFECNQSYTVGSPETNQQIRDDLFVPVTFASATASVAADGEVTLSLVHPGNSSQPVDVYLESTGGYLPTQRATVTAGSPKQIKFIASGMQSGDSAKVKVGYKDFPGVSQCTVTVS